MDISKRIISVIGLGYVGLPVAIAFSEADFSVIGFDISKKRINELKAGNDKTFEVVGNRIHNKNIVYTDNENDIDSANFYVITVPTPVNENLEPDISHLINASELVGKFIKKEDVVVYESTVYPGCTEEDCVPVLEKVSGLKAGKDFHVGYSPERINPGDPNHRFENILKVVSGQTNAALEIISNVYGAVVNAGIYKAESIKVAEAAKVIENTQRDLNIAFVNELSQIFLHLNIDTHDVLRAANTKWNFNLFEPGLVGGHCIGVDPYYLLHKAEGLGYHAKVINSGRYVNDSMGYYIAKQTVKKILATGKNIAGSRVLIMGATFKEDVSDIRNSKIIDVIKELKSFSANVEVVDPHASNEEMKEEYLVELTEKVSGKYDAVIVAVNHKEYASLSEDYFKTLMDDKGVFVDVKGIFKDKVKAFTYISL